MPNFDGYPLDTSTVNSTVQHNDHPDGHNAIKTAANELQVALNAAVTTISSNTSNISANASAITTLQSTAVSLQNQINSIAASGSDATAVAAALTTHKNNTGGGGSTPVHGILDTTKLVTSTDSTVLNVVRLTAAAYAALSPPVATTLYCVVG